MADRKDELTSVKALDTAVPSGGRAASKHDPHEKAKRRTWATLLIELLFVAMPFLVILTVLGFAGKAGRIWGMSEWAFAGVVLSGQAVTKFISGALAKKQRGTGSEPLFIVLIAVAACVFIFFAGLVLYKIVETKEAGSAPSELSSGLICWQLVFFGIGVLLFIIIGGAGELSRLIEEEKTK